MPKYLCLQRRLPGEPGTPPSPAQMQEMYGQFNAWREKYQANLTDMGGRLGDGKLVTGSEVDGPFVEVKELVGGYMIIAADTLDAASEIARLCPGVIGPASGIEVIEIRGP